MTDLLSTSHLYSTVADAECVLHPVPDVRVRALAEAVHAFYQTAASAVSHDVWRPFLFKVKRYLFNLRAAPVPSNHDGLKPPSLTEYLNLARQALPSYPALQTSFEVLEDAVVGLWEAPHDPLGRGLRELLRRPQGNVAILLKEKRLLQVVASALDLGEREPELQLILPRHLHGDCCYSAIYVIGPTYWYPSHVFTAPRARAIHLVAFDWQTGEVPTSDCFPASLSRAGSRVRSRTEGPRGPRVTVPDLEVIELDDDWTGAVTQQISGPDSERGGAGGGEEVEARLFLLEDEHVVFLALGDSVYVLNTDLDEHPVPERKPIEDLRSGDFIVLRVEGSGDYVRTVADAILGPEAARIRGLQQDWKNRLWLHVAAAPEGSTEVAVRLLDLGSQLADEANVRRWASPRHLWLQHREDFDAIMRLTELEHRADEYRDAMYGIRAAHISAGHRIKKLLLAKATSVRSDDLDRAGVMGFELEEEDAGRLTAFRILRSAPEVSLVGPRLLEVPFPLDLVAPDPSPHQ